LFDVAFSELIVIAIVALIVIGPERLPKVARTLGALVGRMQRYVGHVKADIERQMQFEDLQKLQQEIKQGANTLQSGVQQTQTELFRQQEMGQQDMQRSLKDGLADQPLPKQPPSEDPK
jgi:sec-independent protein translocase protein TatB